ncbi:MAG: hypothetical protein QOJ89_844 [bacterium]|jgi:hypothetical protein
MTRLDADIAAVMTARNRCRLDVGVIMLAVVAACSTAIAPGSPLRAVAILAALLLVPGWAVLSLTDSGPPTAMLGVAIGLSLGIDVLASIALVWIGAFTAAPAFAAFAGAVAVAQLARDAVLQARSLRADMPAPQGAR